MHLVLASFFGDPRLANGPAQLCRSLSEACTRRGHQVSLWSGILAKHPEEDYREADPLEILPLPYQHPRGHAGDWLEPWRPNPRVRRFATEELKRQQPDLLLLGAWRNIGDVALAAQDAGIPCIHFLHDYSILCLRSWLQHSSGDVCSGPECAEKCASCLEATLGTRGRIRRVASALPGVGGPLSRLLGWPRDPHWTLLSSVRAAQRHMEEVLNAGTRIVAQAPRTREILLHHGVPEERIALVPQVPTPDKIVGEPVLRQPPGDDRPLRFAFLGRWGESKGGPDLVQAFLEAKTDRPMELWLIVSNPRQLELPPLPQGTTKQIRVLAGYSGAASSEVLRQADLCVVPSRCEDLASRAALEAMAHGVPVVASSTVGNAYLIEDGVNGRVFPAGSRRALRTILEEVARDPGAPARWSAKLPAIGSTEAWEERMMETLESLLPGST